jgi:hypothetical protein
LRRGQVLRTAETLLIQEETPIVPLYFYNGLSYYDSNRIEGIFSNPLAEHPIRAIARRAPGTAPGPKRR